MTRKVCHLMDTKVVILLLISAIALTGSCRKGEEPTPDDDNVSNDIVQIREYVPVDQAFTGTLVAVKYLNFDETGLNITGTSGRAWAKFPGFNEFMTAGDVRIAGNKMDEDSEHIYSFNEAGTVPGINFGQGNSSWDISGSLTVPSTSFIVPGGFPQMTDVIYLNDTINRNVDYSFGTSTGIQNADSVRFTIFSLSSYVFANKEAGEQYHTFKPELLQHLTPGKGLIMMTAFRFIPITASGTEWAVLHQVSAFKEVYIN